MHCSTPQTTMPRWLSEVFMVQSTSLHNGLIARRQGRLNAGGGGGGGGVLHRYRSNYV